MAQQLSNLKYLNTSDQEVLFHETRQNHKAIQALSHLTHAVGIKHFAFVRVYPDYSFNILSNDIMLGVKHFEFGIWKYDPLWSFEQSPVTKKYSDVIPKELNEKYLDYFNISDGFFQERNYFSHRDYIEFAFDNEKKTEYSLGNVKYIESLFDFFYQDIDFCYDNRITMPEKFSQEYTPTNNDFIMQHTQHYELLCRLMETEYSTSVSKIQYKLIYLLANNFQAKTIAKFLQKSHRTIEGQIEKLKVKFSAVSKPQLQILAKLLCERANLEFLQPPAFALAS